MYAPLGKHTRVGDLSGERVLNYSARPGDGASQLYLVGRHGLKRAFNPGEHVIDMIEMGGELYALALDGLYKISRGAASRVGSILVQPGAYIAANATQIAITTGGRYYVYDGTKLEEISTGAVSNPQAVVYADRRFVVSGSASMRDDAITVSALGDGKTFDALDFAFAESEPDRIVGLATLQGLVYAFGQKTIEIFYNSNAADFPYSVNPGSTVKLGCRSGASIATAEDAIYWIGEDNRVRRTQGVATEIVSTRESEEQIAPSEIYNGFICNNRQHKYYVVRLSGRPAQALDLSTGLWSEFSSRALHDPWIATCSYIFNSTEYIGTEKGSICTVGGWNDDGEVIRAEVFGTPIANNGEWFSVNKMRCAFVTGREDIARPAEVVLQVSRDRINWSNSLTRSLGSRGEYRKGVEWHALGAFEDGQLRLWITDEVNRDLEGVALS